MESKFEFVECSICASKPGSPTLCESCLKNRNTIEYLNSRIFNLEKDLEVSDHLLNERNKVLNAIPKCKVHGSQCIPNAIEWIERVKTLGNIIFNKDNKIESNKTTQSPKQSIRKNNIR